MRRITCDPGLCGKAIMQASLQSRISTQAADRQAGSRIFSPAVPLYGAPFLSSVVQTLPTQPRLRRHDNCFVPSGGSSNTGFYPWISVASVVNSSKSPDLISCPKGWCRSASGVRLQLPCQWRWGSGKRWRRIVKMILIPGL